MKISKESKAAALGIILPALLSTMTVGAFANQPPPGGGHCDQDDVTPDGQGVREELKGSADLSAQPGGKGAGIITKELDRRKGSCPNGPPTTSEEYQ